MKTILKKVLLLSCGLALIGNIGALDLHFENKSGTTAKIKISGEDSLTIEKDKTADYSVFTSTFPISIRSVSALPPILLAQVQKNGQVITYQSTYFKCNNDLNWKQNQGSCGSATKIDFQLNSLNSVGAAAPIATGLFRGSLGLDITFSDRVLPSEFYTLVPVYQNHISYSPSMIVFYQGEEFKDQIIWGRIGLPDGDGVASIKHIVEYKDLLENPNSKLEFTSQSHLGLTDEILGIVERVKVQRGVGKPGIDLDENGSVECSVAAPNACFMKKFNSCDNNFVEYACGDTRIRNLWGSYSETAFPDKVRLAKEHLVLQHEPSLAECLLEIDPKDVSKEDNMWQAKDILVRCKTANSSSYMESYIDPTKCQIKRYLCKPDLNIIKVLHKGNEIGLECQNPK